MKYNDYLVKQHDATDCAAACLATICMYYKKETTITKLRDMMGTDIKGTNLVGLSKCASQLGFTSQAVRVDKEGFKSKYTLPAIANVITKEGLTHFVVIFKITEKYVVIGDPAKELMRMTIDEFYKEFTGILMIIKPNEEFETGKIKGEKVFNRFLKLMLGYFEHIYKLPMQFFSTRKTGDIITRFSDAFTIKDIFTNVALTLIMDISMALITGVLLFKMNSTLFIIIVFMTIINIILVLIFKYPYKKLNEQQMQQNSVLNSQIIEGLRAVETIKGNANEESELENIEKEYIKSLRLGFREGMLSNVQGSISSLVSSLGNLILMYVGISQVLSSNMTLGSVMAFTSLSGYFLDPVGRLVGLQLQIQEASISMKRIAEILDYDTEQSDIENNTYDELEKINGDIKINNITFRYGNRKPVLNNISFDIPNGKKVALVGSSGSGKSTIAKLLLKYYEPESGNITIDGTDINEYSNTSIRRGISYVPQSIELFSKSIYDNIRASKINSTLEEVKEAAKLAGADEFIRKLPMQYHTYLEEAGSGLSGGEKQRIAIARAFLKRNDFYILDESTSNLDFATENIIFDMIYNKFKNKSMLIIAHRLATIKDCDEIIVMGNGEILEKGTHDELLNKKGEYYKLWQMQQGNFSDNNIKNIKLLEEINIEDEISYT